MVVFTIAFFAHAIEVAFSVKNTDTKVEESSATKFDFTRTQKSGRIGTAMMILGFILLFAGVILRGPVSYTLLTLPTKA